MTRITERSPYYPDGVRKTSTTEATYFLPDLLPDGTVNDLYAPPAFPCEVSGIVPSMGSLELAYEPDGGAGEADMDTGDDARDQGPTMEPEYE
jgi:hypothetical protein